MSDVHRRAPVDAPTPQELVDHVLKPILCIRGMALSDRRELEGLVAECERSADTFPDDPDAAFLDVYIGRVQRVLRRAGIIAEKYSAF